MILVVIIGCEIGFWLVVLGGLAARYLMGYRRVGTALLVCAPIIDVLLLGAVTAIWPRRPRPPGTTGSLRSISGSHAAFAAMKEVEVAVRRRADLPDDKLGVDLMNQAFREGGPLWRDSLHKGESVAQMSLFAGAIGLFKNPSSHRSVNYDDATLAAEVILLADLLLRVLDRIEPVSE